MPRKKINKSFFKENKKLFIGALITLVIGTYGGALLKKTVENTVGLPKRVKALELKCDSIINVVARHKRYDRRRDSIARVEIKEIKESQ